MYLFSMHRIAILLILAASQADSRLPTDAYDAGELDVGLQGVEHLSHASPAVSRALLQEQVR